MQMARADQDDIDLVIDFFQFVEEFMDHETMTPEDSEDAEPLEITDEEFVMKLRDKWGYRFGPALVDAAWRRVVFGYGVLVDNVCDKEKDILDLRPDWKSALESYEAAAKDGA